LSNYLQIYAVATSINVSARSWINPAPQLQLPLARLPLLQSLQVKNLLVSAPGDDEAAPVLDAALTGLTCLQLTQHKHPMSLQGLPTLTALQRLQLDITGSSAAAAAELAAALPSLAHLTALQLRGSLTVDACLTGLSSLTVLQTLALDDFHCSAASFARLPASLAGLTLKGPGDFLPDDAAGGDHLPLVLDPASTPGIARLTCLESLHVCAHKDRAVDLHVAVLTALTRLTLLEVFRAQVKARPGEPTLSALTALKRLQVLEMSKSVTVLVWG
jgi:hypothetical protein